MTTIESKKVLINKPKKLFNFISDFNNFEELMPEQVQNWSSTKDECSFTIKGMASLGMRIVERKPFDEIKIASSDNSPFEFSIYCTIENSSSGSSLQLTMNAELNALLKMMAKKPLENFLNLLVEKAQEIDQSKL